MKISKTGMINFDMVEIGQCFECNGLIYIKSYNMPWGLGKGGTNLNSGSIESFTGSEECVLYENAEVKLNDKS